MNGNAYHYYDFRTTKRNNIPIVVLLAWNFTSSTQRYAMSVTEITTQLNVARDIGGVVIRLFAVVLRWAGRIR